MGAHRAAQGAQQANLPLQVLHEASNGIEAWDWLAAHEADLVLTDIRMPVMDGLTLLQEMKRSRHPADVMIVSGHDDFAYAQQALRLGARDYLLKPVETDEVIRRIGPWIEERERSASAANGAARADPAVRWEELSPVEQVLHHIHAKRSFRLTLAEAAAMVHLPACGHRRHRGAVPVVIQSARKKGCRNQFISANSSTARTLFSGCGEKTSPALWKAV